MNLEMVGHPLLFSSVTFFDVLSEGIYPLKPHEMVHLMILVCWFLCPNVLEGSVLRMAILFSTTICSVGLLELGFIL